MSADTVVGRLAARLEPDDHIVAWGRAWVSRDGRLRTLLAARTLDFVVCTDRHLVLLATGFFSRRPRRRVYTADLDRLTIEECQTKGWQRTLRVRSGRHKPLLLELRRRPNADPLAHELLTRAQPE